MVPRTWPASVSNEVAAVADSGARDAEVEDLGIAVAGHDDVVGLEVAVDDAAGVGVIHRVADAREQRHPLPAGQIPSVREARDRHAVDQLHREEGDGRSGEADFAGLVEARDAGVLEEPEGGDLAFEAVRAGCRREPWPEHLQRDRPGGMVLHRAVHHAHPAFSQHAGDREARDAIGDPRIAGERLGEEWQRVRPRQCGADFVGHRGCSARAQSRRRYSLAAAQSLFTVRSETPRIRAISTTSRPPK